uniref:uncharacterized protein LOC122596057 isoform X2 n=1 Tax=Erigeron canadensis TaxID=72917 RepID=UPI001CB99A0F|nr:uncharacterized protein LOC122596057 isoform X2 [Erigeron canadensis]
MASSSSNVDTSFKSLIEYADGDALHISLEEVKSATNDFAGENLLTQTSSSNIYKGRLMLASGEPVNVVVRTCRKLHILVNEVVMLKDLRHENIVSIFKICDERYNDNGVVLYKHAANKSLDKHLSSISTLGWLQRLHICVKIARALSYLHCDAEENHSLIHANIKSSKILLDHDWEPKLHGFGYAVRAKRNQRYLTNKHNGSLLYMDPAYETTGGLTHKSDVFSFGVVLFEVLCGRDASSVLPSTRNLSHNAALFFTRLVRVHYEDKTLDNMINPDLRKQMNFESLNIFSETAYFCLKEQRVQRPDMEKVLLRLERALELQHKHQSPEHSAAGEDTSSIHLKVNTLDHLKIQLSDIKSATQNFSDKYRIGSGGFATVYKAKLDHFDAKSSSTVNIGETKVDLPKIRSTVAIKRIFNRVDRQGEKGFLAEIELLSKCSHPNIVSLIGFCNEEPEMILIYEYASNGSLEDYLGKNDKITNLTWVERIKICIDVAYGLKYLHTVTEDKECIIHRDIKSANILLNDKWEAKIADFGLSKLHPTYNQRSTLVSGNIGGTQVYIDPEYEKTGNLKTSSDIYSFGVVLCEIMCGNLAYDYIYETMGLPSIVRKCFNDKTIEELVDPHIKESSENTLVLNEGLNLDSLYTFSEIASQCVAEAQAHRPTMEVILIELDKCLHLQNNSKDNLQISLEAIKVGTQNFSDCNCTGKGRLWRVYEGEILLLNSGRRPILAKRFDSLSGDEGNSQFLTELKILFEYKHENFIGLVGYCNEMGEKIIVYEHVSNGTLDKHLDNADLTWIKRLKIGLDVARVLEHLHTGGMIKGTPMIHRSINSSSILLDGDWRAKLSNFEKFSNGIEVDTFMRVDSFGSFIYTVGLGNERSDIYSLGVVLLEMLCGRSSQRFIHHFVRPIPFVTFATWLKDKGEFKDLIFEGIKEQTIPELLDIYSEITFRCLDEENHQQNASEVVELLTWALAFQEDNEIWLPKIPMDYEKLRDMSGVHITSPTMFKEFYEMLCDGFLFQQDKAWFSLGINGKRHVMVSAKQFSYTNRRQRKWQSISKSRFKVAAKMLDISNLKVRIKIKPQLLFPGVNYGVHLVFKFREPGKCLAERMYVNLKYKRGNDNLHSDFATWREDGWMMIELGQILNYEEDTVFEVLLESFSRSYCGSSVYIEGIEFRTIDNASSIYFVLHFGTWNMNKMGLKRSMRNMKKSRIRRKYNTL